MSEEPFERRLARERFSQKCNELQALAFRHVRAAWKDLPADPVERAEFIAAVIRDVEAFYGPDAHAAAVELIRTNRQLAGFGRLDDIVEPDYLGAAAVARMRDKVLSYVDAGREDLALRALLRQCGNTVYNRARNTVKASSALVGTKWCRVPEPAACDFCLLVASRGAVYASQTTALNTKETKNRYHANCRCGAEEVFGDDDMPAPTKRLVDVSEWVGTSKDDWRKAKSDPEFVRHIWQTYIRDDPTREARLGPSRLPAGFEVKYPRPADLPEGSKLPGVTLRDLEIAIVGGTDHRGKPIGGHDYGAGTPGKTEFPPAWNSDDIIHATFLTLENPQWFDIWGQQRVCRREVNGVIMHIAYYPQSDGELKMAHIYPLNGEDVFKNPGIETRGGSVPFDASGLEERPKRLQKVE